MRHSKTREIAGTPAKAAKLATERSCFSNCSDFSGGVPDASSCSVCGVRPRLGALSRCRQCIGASAAEDRDTRTAAATRVAARNLVKATPAPSIPSRKTAGKSPAAVVSSVAIQGGEVTSRQRAAKFGTSASDVDDLAAMTEAILADPLALAALEEAAADLLRPSNDRHAQIKELLTNEQDRAWIAQHLLAIHHVTDGGRNYVTLGLVNDRDRPAAIELASRAQRLFEAARLHQHEDPKDTTRFADRTQKQPPRHQFGREVRSLPHGRKGRK
jgi:hypothetical protein